MQPVGDEVPAPRPLDPVTPTPAELLRLRGVVEQIRDALRDLRRRPPVDDIARLAVDHGIGGPARVAGDDGQARRGRLEVDDPEALDIKAAAAGAARHREDIPGIEVTGPLCRWGRS